LRVFILALDGLDYGLVKRWKLRSLLQKRHGVFEIGREYFHPTIGEPYTPIIWASIITGKKPQEHGVRDWWTYGKLLDRLRYMPLIRWIKGKRRLLSWLGIEPRVPRRDDIKCTTIFDVVKPSVAVNVPTYNDPTEYHRMLGEAVEKGLDEYIRTIWRVHELRKRDTFRALEASEWRLFMAYFDLADLLGHIFFIKKRLYLMRAYIELELLSSKLQSLVPDDTIFLIITDHCMKPSSDGISGEHAEIAFWSLNIDEDWAPRDFTDFYPKILEWVRA